MRMGMRLVLSIEPIYNKCLCDFTFMVSTSEATVRSREKVRGEAVNEVVMFRNKPIGTAGLAYIVSFSNTKI